MTVRTINGNTYQEVAIVAANPIPVNIGSATLSVTADGVEIKNDVGNPIPVDDAGGSLTVDSPELTSLDGKVPADLTVTATRLLVDGSGVTQPVSGPLTDAELRAASVAVNDASGSLTVDGKSYNANILITRPSNTTAYTARDVIGEADSGTPANAGSAIFELANIGPSAGTVLVQSISLLIANSSIPSGMAAFRVHFYIDSPTAILDNAAFNLVSGDRVLYVGFADLPTPQDLGDTLYTQSDYPGRQIKLTGTSLWVQIETIGGYTPASGTEYRLRVSTLEAGL